MCLHKTIVGRHGGAMYKVPIVGLLTPGPGKLGDVRDICLHGHYSDASPTKDVTLSIYMYYGIHTRSYTYTV